MKYPACWLLVCFCVITGFDRAHAAAAKPNFALIYIDDMGYGDIGPFGSTLNRTPNLDRMAAEGMKLTSFYAAPVDRQWRPGGHREFRRIAEITSPGRSQRRP
jgi:hypothetical protein